MHVDQSLKMVIPLLRGDHIYAYVHTTPISREVYEMNYKLLIRTFNGIIENGVVGARVAYLSMNDAAREIAGRADAATVSAPLMNEIKRLSNVITPDAGGYSTMPLEDALNQGRIDPEDVSEVLNAVVFFTAGSLICPKATRKDLLEGGARMWGAQLLSLDSTAYIASLRTLTATANTGANPTPASSVAY